MKNRYQRQPQPAIAAPAPPVVRDKPTHIDGKVLHCYLECIDAAADGDKQPAFDFCRIDLDSGRVTTASAARVPLIWYGTEVALRLMGAMPTFAVTSGKNGVTLTAEALKTLKDTMRKPIITEESVVAIPADGALGVWEGTGVQRGQQYRKLVITGSRQYIESTRLRTAAESKGWTYLICATIDIDSVHLCLFKPAVEAVDPAAAREAPAVQAELEAEPA